MKNCKEKMKHLRHIKCYIFLLLCLINIFVISITSFADWEKTDYGYRYKNNVNGQYVVNNWLQTGNGYYYFDSNGLTVKGWYLINGNYYYFNEDGLMLTGFIDSNGSRYYLNPQNGVMVTGWIQTYENGTVDYYYFDESGVMVKGWHQIGSDWYYFYDGKAIVDTWAKINELWYHFNQNGFMDTGWVNTNGKMYYLNVSNGSLQKGWIQDQYGNEYYLSEIDGSLAVNTTIMIGGVGYTFDETGRCISKGQYSYTGDIYGNANNNNVAVLGNKGVADVYGVNIGVSPGTNMFYGAETSMQQQQHSQSSLEPGLTTGPK